MASLFISYSRKDREAAHKLTEAFKGPDLDFWIDWDDIPPSVDWWKEIEKGIEEADIFLFLLSPDSGSSRVCWQEIEHAVKNGKRLIPVVVRNIPASEAPPELRPLNWIYLREEDNFRAGFSKLIQAIKTDYAWVQVHRRLQMRALEWEKKNDRSLLLRGNDLRQAEEQLATSAHKDPQPTDLQRRYVLESRRRESQTRNSLLVIGALVIVALAFLSLFAFNQSNRANANERVAVTNEQKAKEQANIALARQLAAQAQQLFTAENSQQEIAVLLAIQSLRLFPSENASRVLQEDTLTKSISYMMHDDWIESAAFSPDGNYVVSGSADHTARVWETDTGKEIARMMHNAGVNVVTFSPDGKYIASGSHDGNIRVWEALTGKEIAQMQHEGKVYTIAFSPDGAYVASGGCDQQNTGFNCLQGSARVWEAATGKEVSRMTHEGRVNRVLFSPDGKHVVSGSDDQTARVWDTETGKEISRMTHSGRVSALDFSRDGKYVASAGIFDTLRVWEAATGTEITEVEPNGPVYSVAFSLDGNLVASGGCVEVDIRIACLQGSVQVWEALTGKEIAVYSHDSVVHEIVFSPNSRYLVSGSEDGIARVWDIYSKKEVARMTHEASVSSVAFSPRGEYVLSTGDHFIRLWRADMEKEIIRLAFDDRTTTSVLSPQRTYVASAGCDREASASTCLQSLIQIREVVTGKEVARWLNEGEISSIAFSPNDNYVATGSSTGAVRIWEVAAGKQIAGMTLDDRVSALAFSPGGKYVAAGGSRGTTRVWEAAIDKAIAEMNPGDSEFMDEAILSVVFSPDGKYVISGGADQSARVWEVAAGKEIVHVDHDGPVSAIDVSPDGKYVVSAGEYTIQVWETLKGNVIVSKTNEALGLPAEIISLDFSPDGRYVVSGGLDNTAAVWEAFTGKEIAHMTHGIERAIVHAAFSPDGKYIVSGSNGNSISVWETFTGKEIAHFSQGEQIISIRFSPDGKFIISVDRGSVRVWVYRPEDLINETCSRVTRNLTYDQWITYIGDAIPYPTRQEEETCPNLPIEPAATATPTSAQ